MADARAARGVPVWDAAVRLFHWVLVGLIAFSWWSAENHRMEWHRRSGYAILALLVFRLIWGFVGGRTALFAHFVKGPRATIAYIRRPASAPDTPGHNPLGGWSVLAMLATLVAMVSAGLFAVDVDGLESGPLADRVSFEAGRAAAKVHATIFNLLLVLITLHVAAIFFYLVVRRRNLIGPMIHGRARAGTGEPAVPLGGSAWRAGAALAIGAGCAWAVSTGFRV